MSGRRPRGFDYLGETAPRPDFGDNMAEAFRSAQAASASGGSSSASPLRPGFGDDMTNTFKAAQAAAAQAAAAQAARPGFGDNMAETFRAQAAATPPSPATTGPAVTSLEARRSWDDEAGDWLRRPLVGPVPRWGGLAALLLGGLAYKRWG